MTVPARLKLLEATGRATGLWKSILAEAALAVVGGVDGFPLRDTAGLCPVPAGIGLGAAIPPTEPPRRRPRRRETPGDKAGDKIQGNPGDRSGDNLADNLGKILWAQRSYEGIDKEMLYPLRKTSDLDREIAKLANQTPSEP